MTLAHAHGPRKSGMTPENAHDARSAGGTE
jgi:hypothetical protein